MNLADIHQRISCGKHQGEPIVRVSLNLKDEKLFFCHECLDKDTKVNKGTLVKLCDVIPKLQDQYSSQKPQKDPGTVLSKEIMELYENQRQIELEFAELVNKERKQMDEQIKKMQEQMIQLLHKVRVVIQDRLDQYEKSFGENIDNFISQIQLQEKLLANRSETPSQEQLKIRIFDGKTTEEAENNLKEVLTEIKTLEEVQSGKSLENCNALKNGIEEMLENSQIIPQKDQRKYVELLESLGVYLRAVLNEISVNKDEGTNNNNNKTWLEEKEKKFSQELVRILKDLTKHIEDSSTAIKKLLEQKFSLQKIVKNYKCLFTEAGDTATRSHAFQCKTCINELGLSDNQLICEDCSTLCHEGHEIIDKGEEMDFICACQFTMKICKLAKCCLREYTGKSYRMQAYWRCKSCNLGPSAVLCAYCALSCHEGHDVRFDNIGTAYCDCKDFLPSCSKK